MTLSSKVDYANGTRYLNEDIEGSRLQSRLAIQTIVEGQKHDEFESRNPCRFYIYDIKFVSKHNDKNMAVGGELATSTEESSEWM